MFFLFECNFKKEVILVGDFDANWKDQTNRKRLKSLTNSFDLIQLIKEPTRITNSSETCIDLVFSNKHERIQKTFNIVTGLSDHNMILFSRKLAKNRFTRPPAEKSEQLRITKGEIKNLEIALSVIKFSEHFTCKQVD